LKVASVHLVILR